MRHGSDGPTVTDVPTTRTGPDDAARVAGPDHVDVGTDEAVGSRASRPSSRAFPWAVPPGATGDEVRVGRRRWYGGAAFGLLWQALTLIQVWADGGSLARHVVSTAALVVFYAAYLFSPEAMWGRGIRVRGTIVGLLAVWAGLLLVVVGPVAIWTWVLVVAISGFVAARVWTTIAVVVVVVLAQFAVALTRGWTGAVEAGILFAPLITVSVGASMVLFGRQRETEDRLGVAQDELTRLAVVEERARFSRDLHDVLGHSLTVVAMKSELAGRLAEADPARAGREMREVEQLAREALQGLRQAVSGYREADLDAELVSACSALRAAGIEATVPTSGGVVAQDVRSLFAWAVREGVTNVLRHAGASRVRVTLSRTAVTIEDDGTGADLARPGPFRGGADGRAGSGGAGVGGAGVGGAGAATLSGNGLRGMRERADAVGATVTTGRSPLGGFLLRVERRRR